MEKGFDTTIKPIMDRFKKMLEIEEYIEKELKVLEEILSKVNVDKNYLNNVVVPQIEKIKTMILKINQSKNSEDDSITSQALRNISDSTRFKKIEGKFNYLNNKFFNISKKFIREESDDELWWKKQEDREEKSAELWEKTHQKNKDTK